MKKLFLLPLLFILMGCSNNEEVVILCEDVIPFENIYDPIPNSSVRYNLNDALEWFKEYDLWIVVVNENGGIEEFYGEWIDFDISLLDIGQNYAIFSFLDEPALTFSTFDGRVDIVSTTSQAECYLTKFIIVN